MNDFKKENVINERYKFIGGSDITIIFGKSSFKTREELLIEKYEQKEVEDISNIYIDFGNFMEPKLREFFNKKYNVNCQEFSKVDGAKRANVDGLDIEKGMLIEIKTCNYDNFKSNFEKYNLQIQFYLDVLKLEKANLIVYNRPDNFVEIMENENYEVDLDNYYEFEVEKDDVLINEINKKIDAFLNDLEKLKLGCTIYDLQSTKVNQLAEKLDNQLFLLKEVEENAKSMREKLYENMDAYNIDKLILLSGTQIKKVNQTQDKEEEVEELDIDLLKKEQPEIYEKYLVKKTKVKKGKKGFVLIKLGKKEN